MSNNTVIIYHMPIEMYRNVEGLIGHSPLNKCVDNIVSDMEHANWEYYDIFWFLVYFYYEERAQQANRDHINRISRYIGIYERYLNLARNNR